MGKMKVIRISDGNGSDVLVESFKEVPECIGDSLECLGIGDKFTLTIEEVEKKKFEQLPEWDGF